MNKLDYYLFKLSSMFLTLYFICKESCKKSKFLYYISKPFIFCKKKISKKKVKSIENTIIIDNVYIVKNLQKNKKKYKKEIKDFSITKKNIPKIEVGDIIEIHYTIYYIENNRLISKKYIVPYMHPSNIQFPPYNIEEIKEYNTSQNYKNGILDASCNNKDITDYITQLAGPKGNFYKDIPSRYGIRVPVSLVQNTLDDTIEITDNCAKDYIFTKLHKYIEIDS